MTRQNRYRAIALGLASALMLTLMAGCGSHDAAPAAPAGTTMGQPMTPAEIQAAQQARANKGNQPASTPPAAQTP